MRFNPAKCLLLACMALPSVALADPIDFSFSTNFYNNGFSIAPESVSFVLPNSTPTSVHYTSTSFRNVSLTVGGTNYTDGEVTFFSPTLLAQFSLPNENLSVGTFSGSFTAVEYGNQLYGGTLAAPTFTNGSYALNAYPNGGQGGGSGTGLNDSTLVVTGGLAASVSSTPEPSSMLLLGTGIAAIGGVSRRRRRAS